MDVGNGMPIKQWLNNDRVINSYSNLIETIDVSFVDMIKLLLWKNYKQQFQRRKVSWIIKMILPVIFSLILGILRNSYTVNTESIDYGNKIEMEINRNIDIVNNLFNDSFGSMPFNLTLNTPFAINPINSKSSIFINLPLCVMNWSGAAPFIGIAPKRNTNKHIDAVLDIMNKDWSAQYPPNQTIIDNLGCIEYAQYLPFTEGWLLKYFNNDNEMDIYCKDNEYGKGYDISSDINDTKQQHRPNAFGIIFDEAINNGLEWKYKLRFNSSGSKYIANITGQQSMDNTMNDEIYNMTKGFFVFPTPSYQSDTFWFNISRIFVFFILIGFIYPYSQIIKDLVEEKSDKIKEGMKMMGATFNAFWISWYLWFFMEFIIIAILYTFISTTVNVFKYSDFSVIFLWILLFCINMVTFGTLISTLFDNPKIATLVSILFTISLYGGFFAVVIMFNWSILFWYIIIKFISME